MAVDVASLTTRLGDEIAVSDWLEVTQARIDGFAEATGDHQWIHVDAERAASDSPFHATIAHGFLTLSLISVLMRSAMTFERLRLAVNYGVNRVRFVAAVPAGSRVRARFAPQAVEPAADAGQQVTWRVTIEREGADRPACVAEWIVRYYLEPPPSL